MIVDLYCSCWNNADMLPFLFRHYDTIVRRYVVFDDGSTDGSLQILNAHPRVEIRPMPKSDPMQARALATLSPAETCWRETSADADWVVMCDNDEHLYHPDLGGYLERCLADGVTIIPALGYQMVSDTFPTGGLLCEQITSGAPWGQMSKMNLFHPAAIERLNYSPGRHTAEPTGVIVAPDRDEVLLLHYKYLNFERIMRRHAAACDRLNAVDVQNGFGHRWRFTREQLAEDWASFERRAIDIYSEPEPGRTHPEPRWWERYRRSAQLTDSPAL